MSAGVHEPVAPAAAASLARMLQFGDSMFPIGGFAFSGGLESAVQKGVVSDAATLEAYARTAVEQAAIGDGIALVWAHRAAAAGDLAELVRIDRRVYARKLAVITRASPAGAALTVMVRVALPLRHRGQQAQGARPADRRGRRRTHAREGVVSRVGVQA